jgi:hypothetical protein
MSVSPLLVGFHGKEGEGEVCRLHKGSSSRSRLVWRLGMVEFLWRVDELEPAVELVIANDSVIRFVGSGGPGDVSRSTVAEEDVLQYLF